MSGTTFVEDRLRFLEISEDVVQELHRARSYIEPELDTILAGFYEHILNEAELKALFVDDESIDRARAAQKKHWLNTLFYGRFDSAYFDQTEKIGRSHARVGLAPNWYIGGYSIMLTQFIEQIIDETRKEGRDPRATLQAVCKAVLLDVDLVIHCYLEAKNESMRQTLRRATQFTADIAELNKQLSVATEDVQASAVRLKGDDAGSADQVRDLLERVERLQEKSKMIDERLGELQFRDKLYINEDVPTGDSRFTRLKKLFRAR